MDDFRTAKVPEATRRHPFKNKTCQPTLYWCDFDHSINSMCYQQQISSFPSIRAKDHPDYVRSHNQDGLQAQPLDPSTLFGLSLNCLVEEIGGKPKRY